MQSFAFGHGYYGFFDRRAGALFVFLAPYDSLAHLYFILDLHLKGQLPFGQRTGHSKIWRNFFVRHFGQTWYMDKPWSACLVDEIFFLYGCVLAE